MLCPACAAENPTGGRFCEDCGCALSLSCPGCGAAVTAGKGFCRECGTALAPGPAVPTAATAQAERRVVSVLFADLVGFTTLAEGRDAEEVRELLSRYFDTARTVVARYGGVIEKFIGDAVMAVWGVPTAHGDDAERAVRAALELAESVAALGHDSGLAGLAARAGVVTGEVAVTLGAVGEGMVAGDAVNTAARVQAEADAGGVLVDDVTRQATAAAIGYADTGPHVLKGKADAIRLWRVTRVVGAAGGSERVDGLEAGFLGRDAELRAVKDALHACVDGHRAQLVSVVGAAGVGKSRLRWEFFKYVDGLAETVLWHTGRCLPYGDGVAYWALAEIVRARLDIAEEESAEQVSAKLAAGLLRWVTDEADREFLLPRLGVLLGVADPSLSREELFAGWRLWIERLTEHHPVVLVIDDLQWADSGLLDFLEHLLDWSADQPVFLLTMTRPELVERRPLWGTGRRNSTVLALGPLPDPVMAEVLAELVPGLPTAVSGQIVARADGVPLYAVELVRSLIDRDLVQPVDGSYRLVDEVGQLDVPASLVSLVASRIDALPAAERSLVQALSVVGSTFPRAAVGAVTDLPADEVDVLLADLVRKEILRVRTDRHSPDRGQYAFTQSLLRSVAYDTLSRRDRKARHLTVAAHLRATFPDDGAEVAEVVAQHYRDAYDAVPDDGDAAEVRDLARGAFVRAGQRAMSLGAPETAELAFRTAAGLCTDEAAAADLLAEAGGAALQASRFEAAIELLERAVAAHRAGGRERDAAGVTELLAYATSNLGHTERAIALLLPALEVAAAGEPDEMLARIHNRLAHLYQFSSHPENAVDHIEAALVLSQALELPAALAEAAIGKGMVLARADRYEEALAAFEWGAQLADSGGMTREAQKAHGNAADMAMNGDQLTAATAHLNAALELARRRGEPSGEGFAAYNRAVLDLFLGRWTQVDGAMAALLHRFDGVPVVRLFAHLGWAQLHASRGELALLSADLDAIAELRENEDVQNRGMHATVMATVAAAGADHAATLKSAVESVQLILPAFGVRHECVRRAWPLALDAALAMGDIAAAQGLMPVVADRPVGHVPPYLRSQLARFQARLAAARGEHGAVEEGFATAERILDDLGYPYELACVRRDHGSWLLTVDRAGEAMTQLRAAEQHFELLGAGPALARCRDLLPDVTEEPASSFGR